MHPLAGGAVCPGGLRGVSKTTAQIAAAPTYPLQTGRPLLQRISNLMEQFGMTQQIFSTGQMIRG